MVLSVAVRVAALLAGSRSIVEITEIRGSLRGHAGVEVDHSPVRPGSAADHAMRIVARGAADAGMVPVRALIPHRRQVVALAAQSPTGGTTASAPTSAGRILKQIQLQQMRVDGAVRSVRAGSVRRSRLIAVVAIRAIEQRRCCQGPARVVGDAIDVQHVRAQAAVRRGHRTVACDVVPDRTGELQPQIVLVGRPGGLNRIPGRHRTTGIAHGCAAVSAGGRLVRAIGVALVANLVFLGCGQDGACSIVTRYVGEASLHGRGQRCTCLRERRVGIVAVGTLRVPCRIHRQRLRGIVRAGYGEGRVRVSLAVLRVDVTQGGGSIRAGVARRTGGLFHALQTPRPHGVVMRIVAVGTRIGRHIAVKAECGSHRHRIARRGMSAGRPTAEKIRLCSCRVVAGKADGSS